MAIEVACSCRKRFSAQEHLAGTTFQCPACGSPLTVPAARPEPQRSDHVRCEYCHEYVPRSQYNQHVDQHLELREDGQQSEYATLPPEDRMTAYDVNTVPRWYRHDSCGEVTGMPEEIIETYLTNPWFYLSDKTFCTGCHRHVRLKECVWEETGEDLQTYTDRLRADKPHLRPGPLKRMFAAVINALT